jgi:hypothetical protein
MHLKAERMIRIVPNGKRISRRRDKEIGTLQDEYSGKPREADKKVCFVILRLIAILNAKVNCVNESAVICDLSARKLAPESVYVRIEIYSSDYRTDFIRDNHLLNLSISLFLSLIKQDRAVIIPWAIIRCRPI